MKLLKAIVIFMGVLIITGVIVIIVTIYNRSQINLDKSLTSQLLIPSKSEVLQIVPLKEGIGIYLLFPSGEKYIYVYDIIDGKLISEISIRNK